MLVPRRSFTSSRSSREYDHSRTPSLTSTSDGTESRSSDTGDTPQTPPNLSSPQGSLSKLGLRAHIGALSAPPQDHLGADACRPSTPFRGSSPTEHPHRTVDCNTHEEMRASPALPEPVLAPLSSSLSTPYRAAYSTASSALHPSLHARLAEILATPSILRLVLASLAWEEFMTFVNASGAVRRFFNLHDVATREIVLDRFVSGYVTGQRHEDWDEDGDIVRVWLGDLEALMVSQSRSLSTYPTHAIVSLSMSPDIADNHARMLARLASAHSRFVLLLHKRARNARGDTFHWRGMRHIHNITMMDDSDIDRLPELRIPAPLSYFPQSAGGAPTMPTHEVSIPSLIEKVRSTIKVSKKPSTSRPPPPSPSAVHTLRYRSNRGRLSYDSGFDRTVALSPSNNSISRRKGALHPVALLPTDALSSRLPDESSLSLSSSSSSFQSFFIPPNPHALLTATSRYFSPVLRVFVPCGELSRSAIKACEGQLVRAGLWEHVSIGDIVVNLGYVPLLDDGEPKWLIHDGVGLVPFNPRRSAPPISNSLDTLPCPTYHAHLTRGTDPFHCIRIPPDIRAEAMMSLVRMPTTVLKTRGMGRMRVTRYAWTARFPVLGAGLWSGEWILEGEATPEGQRMLQRTLQGRETFLWRVVLDKCVNGVVWLQFVQSIGGKIER